LVDLKIPSTGENAIVIAREMKTPSRGLFGDEEKIVSRSENLDRKILKLTLA
jgi:hypothetical protein